MRDGHMHRRRRLTATTVGLISIALVVGAGGAVGAGGGADNTVSAKLSGKNEVPGPGDKNGSGEAVLKLNKKKLRISFDISFEGIHRPVAGHIHKGPRQAADPGEAKAPEESGSVRGTGGRDVAGIGPRELESELYARSKSTRDQVDQEQSEQLVCESAHAGLPRRRDPRPAEAGRLSLRSRGRYVRSQRSAPYPSVYRRVGAFSCQPRRQGGPK